MFKNYLTAAIRSFRKNRLYTLINISGLALGLAVAILIGLYVEKEFSYDKWVPGHEQVYRVYRQWLNSGNTVWSPDPIAEAMTAQIPEISAAAGLTPYGEALVEHGNHKLYVEHVAQVDSTFLKVVKLPMTFGTEDDVLNPPNAAVISSRLAEILYGDANPIGQRLRFNDESDLQVTGVLAPQPGKSHLYYEIYIRYDWESPSWTGNNRATYVHLIPGSNITNVESKISDLIRPHWEQDILNAGGDPTAQAFPKWRLQPMKEIHLQSANFGWIGSSGGDIKYVLILIIIGVIVMVIGGINYINLSTARAAERAKEVGVRKVSGAIRWQLGLQFISEAFVQTLLAFLFAILLSALFLPFFNDIVNRDLTLFRADWVILVPVLIGLVLFMSVLAGGYPAVVLSAFKPIVALKGRMQRGSGGRSFRRALVIAQFALSVVLVITMLFIHKQVGFMMKKDLGFSGEQLLSIPLNSRQSHRKIEQLKSQLTGIPGVVDVTTASRLPGRSLPDWTIDLEGQFDTHSPEVLFVDEDYMKTLGLQLDQGRFLSKDFAGDTINNYVVNESFVNTYQIPNPLEQRVKFMGNEEYGRIVGVIKDFHYRSLEVPVEPLMIGGMHNRWYAGLKLSTSNLPATIEEIESFWAQIEPAHPMRYSFVDSDFAKQYDEYRRFGKALLYATILAMLVAILGLFGLATYATTTRIKEIGVRKVLGASVPQITIMLITDFVKWVLIAGILAIPISWYLVNRWLDDFALQTAVTPVPFLIAIGGALVLASLTVQFRAARAARNNPVEALRYE